MKIPRELSTAPRWRRHLITERHCGRWALRRRLIAEASRLIWAGTHGALGRPGPAGRQRGQRQPEFTTSLTAAREGGRAAVMAAYRGHGMVRHGPDAADRLHIPDSHLAAREALPRGMAAAAPARPDTGEHSPNLAALACREYLRA